MYVCYDTEFQQQNQILYIKFHENINIEKLKKIHKF